MGSNSSCNSRTCDDAPSLPNPTQQVDLKRGWYVMRHGGVEWSERGQARAFPGSRGARLEEIEDVMRGVVEMRVGGGDQGVTMSGGRRQY